MLKRIVIKGYKSLVDLDVALEPLVVLFGPNAAGKSNFLDALQLLSRIVTSRNLKEAFEPPYRGKPLESFTLGPEGIPELLKRETATFTMQVDIELSQHVIDSVDQQIREMKRPAGGNGTGHKTGDVSLATVRERALRYRVEVEILPRSGI